MAKKKLFKYVTVSIISLFGLAVVAASALFYQIKQDQPQFFAEPVFDRDPPQMQLEESRFAILVFSKTNGFRHKDAIERGNRFFASLAKKNGWAVFVTENAAVFNAEQLSRFDVVIWNNSTGPALSLAQRQAMERYMQNGGGFVGIHAAGDDSHADWEWYQSSIIRTPFIGHALFPQFQLATINLGNAEHPAVEGFPMAWEHEEEWYSFEYSPRADGVDILATVDEQTYSPGRWLNGKSLGMGDDHPVMWAHQLVGGRVVYTAFGHQGKTFDLPWFQQMLEQSVFWAGSFGHD